MKRTGWLVAFILVLMPSVAFAQQMGGMMGGRGGGMGGMMQNQMGGMQGMMQGQMGGMGGMMTPGGNEVRRAAQVELEGGRHLSGHIDLRSVMVYSDLGQYTLMPEKIKMIRFLKPANEPRPAPKEGEDNAGGDANAPGPAAGMGDPAMGSPTIRAKVIMNSDQEVTGILQIPTSFRIELGFGSLIPTTDKLRSITFTDVDKKTASAGPDAAEPRPAGDAQLEVTPVMGPNLVALALRGPKITRIAVADLASGTWHSQDLREPVAGRAVPIVAQGIVVYSLGRYVYAYSAEAQRWDVAELPEGMQVGPTVGPNGATIQGHGHVFTFIPKTGKWEHIDVRAILDVMKAEKK